MIEDNDQIREIIYILLNNNVKFSEFYRSKINLRESVYAQ